MQYATRRLLLGITILAAAVIYAPSAAAGEPEIPASPTAARSLDLANEIHAPFPPSTSPPVSTRRSEYPYAPPSCQGGYACALDYYLDGWYFFSFYNYGTYSLSNFTGSGRVTNSQTGGAAMRLYGQWGNQILCVPPGPPVDVNWDPVWRIGLTSYGC